MVRENLGELRLVLQQCGEVGRPGSGPRYLPPPRRLRPPRCRSGTGGARAPAPCLTSGRPGRCAAAAAATSVRAINAGTPSHRRRTVSTPTTAAAMTSVAKMPPSKISLSWTPKFAIANAYGQCGYRSIAFAPMAIAGVPAGPTSGDDSCEPPRNAARDSRPMRTPAARSCRVECGASLESGHGSIRRPPVLRIPPQGSVTSARCRHLA